MAIRDNILFVFTSDNGPDPTAPSNGWSGPWRGYYFKHMEGSLRTPFIIRWPGRVSNEIAHEVDTFTTFAKIASAAVPADRPINGVDQSDFLLGKSEKSAREGFPVFVADRLEAVKWRNCKKKIGEGRIEKTMPFKYSTFEGQDIGEDSGMPVDFTYTPPFKLTGKIRKVSVYLN